MGQSPSTMSSQQFHTEWPQLNIIDVVEENNLTENGLRTLLIQCPCCQMFQLPNEPYDLA